jgi:hypothetical protein
MAGASEQYFDLCISEPAGIIYHLAFPKCSKTTRSRGLGGSCVSVNEVVEDV